MDKFLSGVTEALTNPKMQQEFLSGTWETIYSTFLATLLACVLGLVLGVVLVTGGKDGIRPLPSPLMKVLNFIVNILRSVPFLILMMMLLPVFKPIIKTTIGPPAAILPLTAAAAPFVARLVETSLREVDKGVIEAAQSMGCSTMQIICKVILPESKPALIGGFTTALITILGYGSMAGFIGGGGLGKIAINYGYNKYNYGVMFVAVVLIVVLVQIFQTIGTRVAARCDKRIARTNRRSRAAELRKEMRKNRHAPGAM